MSDLVERLRSWAQNEEMIDQYYTDHGMDCNEAADEIERLRAVVDAARELLEQTYIAEGFCMPYPSQQKLHDALRALDGEPGPDCVDGVAPKGGNEGGTRYFCPTCGGSGGTYANRDAPGRTPCPTCKGTGRKP